jgi:hypothetical protein
MTEDQMRELLREMRDEPVPPDSLVRVRMAVDRRVERGRAGSRWKFVAALLAAACLVLGVWMFRPVAPPPKPAPEMIARQIEAPALEPTQLEVPAPVKKVRKKAVLPVRAAAPPSDVLIRIENPEDPDVVLLLLN